jgi:hypothetical protein
MAKFLALVAALLVSAEALTFQSKNVQDPCSGCSDPHVTSYQECMVKSPINPCRKMESGMSADNHCCVVKEKHKRCLGCKASGDRPHYSSKFTDQAASGTTVFEP